MKSALVRLFGFPATLIHGDTLVLDRWLWLVQRLTRTTSPLRLIDIGCGTGAFTIGAALRGYYALGLSWDKRNQHVATQRARICHASRARFEVVDIRALSSHAELFQRFDVAICAETIEHILNDQKLIADIALCLKPGGRLLLTTPNENYRAITAGDNGPFCRVEDGGHVRRGYTEERLCELCREAGLSTDDISYCSGFLSQKITFVLRIMCKVHPLIAWAVTLPLRLLPPLLDRPLTEVLKWPYFSICMEAHKIS